MGFDKLIIGSIVKVAKSNAKFDVAVEDIQAKFKEGCPSKQELTKIIAQKNQITNALNQVVDTLNTIEKTGTTIESILSGLKTAITVIKVLPVPTAVLGVGIPVGIITTLADVLDLLAIIVKKGKGAASIIPDAVGQITKSTQNIIDKLNTLDTAINLCLNQAMEDMTDDEKTAYVAEVGEAVALVGITSNAEDDKAVEEALLAQLQPGSNNPLMYRGFELVIEYDPLNEYSFPARRIKGWNSSEQVLIYNLPAAINPGSPAGYSFSSSVLVLINEAKYRIDSYYSELEEVLAQSILRGSWVNIGQETSRAFMVEGFEFIQNFPHNIGDEIIIETNEHVSFDPNFTGEVAGRYISRITDIQMAANINNTIMVIISDSLQLSGGKKVLISPYEEIAAYVPLGGGGPGGTGAA